MAEQRIADLEKLVQELQDKVKVTQVEVSVPPPRKLSKFNGLDLDVTHWIEDATGAIQGLKDKEQIAFLKRHLEGEAKKEVGLQPTNSIKKAQDVFVILKDAFGEHRTPAKLKRLLYSRVQGEHESVRDYTRCLMDLASRLPNETEATRNSMLKEIIVDNLASRSVREACDTLLRENPETDFVKLRAAAIRLGDREDFSSSVRTNAVETDSASSSATNTEALIQLTATVQQLVQQQTQLLALMSNQESSQGRQPEPAQLATTHVQSLASSQFTPYVQQLAPSQLATSHVQQIATSHVNDGSINLHAPVLSNVQCFRCKNFGHLQTSALCPLYKPGFRRRGRGRGRGPHNFMESNMGNDSTPRQ
jgi:hypothetical protein